MLLEIPLTSWLGVLGEAPLIHARNVFVGFKHISLLQAVRITAIPWEDVWQSLSGYKNQSCPTKRACALAESHWPSGVW